MQALHQSFVPSVMLLMMHQHHLHQPCRLDRCKPVIHSSACKWRQVVGMSQLPPGTQLQDGQKPSALYFKQSFKAH